MLEHGGRLRAAAEKFSIPLSEWMDLSAALNPVSYPVGDIPAAVWQRLPEDDDALHAIAAQYYGTSALLPVAGSQAAIQALPTLFHPMLRVGMLRTTYNEHAHAWQQQGHTLVLLEPENIESALPQLDVLLLVNPNNPTGATFTRTTLLHWHTQLAARNACLIVDEAFIDAEPEQSLVADIGRPGLIVLRSLGKFFGLAGARVGFAFAADDVLQRLREILGPWPISHPARLAAQRALADVVWQDEQRLRLRQQSARLAQLLCEHALTPTGGCALFQWVQTDSAHELYQHLAAQGILLRYYAMPASVRFGLPATEQCWQRLTRALQQFTLLRHGFQR